LDSNSLARGLLVYNREFLAVRSSPAPSMTGFAVGLRFPLPVEIDQTGEGVVNPDLVQAWAGTFDRAWEPLLDQTAATTAAPGPAQLQQEVTDFLAAHPGVRSRGIPLGARAISNAVQALPFATEIFQRAGGSQFELALAMMESLVAPQVGLLASQSAGTAI